ncbi:MAG: ABC transporter permease, partial [Rubrivivax sp.]
MSAVGGAGAVLAVGTSAPRALEAASPARRAWRRLLRRRTAMFGAVVVLGFVLLALAAPWIAPYDPIETSWSAIRQAPSWLHWFGTDDIGRDVLSRVIWGTQASLMAGVVSVSISLLLGVPIGVAA